MKRSTYIFKKLMTDFIIINLVINAVFFVVNFKDHEGIYTLKIITPDLQFGLIILGVLCSLIGFINIKKDLLKGDVHLDDFKPLPFYTYFPKNLFLRVGLLTLLTLIVFVPLFSLIPQWLGFQQINYWIGFAIKTISAGLAALVIGLIVLHVAMVDYRSLRAWEV